MRATVAQVLETEGFVVLTAGDGNEGLRRVLEDHPDLILCDVGLSGMDGYMVLRGVREHPGVAHTPFIFLTAHASTEELRTGMNHGADDYLTKPVTAEGLIAAVNARLARARLFNGARPCVPPPEELEKFGLTPREAEVLHWISQGKSNPDIAAILDLGVATVKTHVLHIFEKLGVENRSGAILKALEIAEN